MLTLKHMTYEEWLAANPDAVDQEEDCEECDGSGEVTCSECGQVYDCDKCGGTGKSVSARDLYEAQLKADKEKLARFLASVPVDQS